MAKSRNELMIPIAKPVLTDDEKDAVRKVLDSGMIVQGPKTSEFEKHFSEKFGFKNSIAVNSGTAALHTACYALGIKAGDEVITTPFSFVATANSIMMQGGIPVFVDISEDDFNIDADLIEEKITSKTKAVLIVNLFGQPCDIDKIKKICKDHNLRLIEDACQSVGAKFKDIYSGNFGDIGCFSLYATKNIMCGEGGVITTNNPDWAELCKRFRHHGQSEMTRYQYLDIGYNYRLTDINAAIADEQLKKLDGFTKKRVHNAKLLSEGLKDIKGLVIPKVGKDRTHVFHQYTIRITKDFVMSREKFMEFLKKSGIGYSIFYPKPLHLFPHIGKFGYKKGDFPVAERVANEVLSLPCHPLITDDDIRFIVDKIKKLSGTKNNLK